MNEIEIIYTPAATEKDRILAALHRPDISQKTCKALQIDSKTIVYIPHWKINKYGLDHFLNKYNIQK